MMHSFYQRYFLQKRQSQIERISGGIFSLGAKIHWGRWWFGQSLLKNERKWRRTDDIWVHGERIELQMTKKKRWSQEEEIKLNLDSNAHVDFKRPYLYILTSTSIIIPFWISTWKKYKQPKPGLPVLKPANRWKSTVCNWYQSSVNSLTKCFMFSPVLNFLTSLFSNRVALSETIDMVSQSGKQCSSKGSSWNLCP